ncbi:unnamed protein product [Mycena citricolor]|uniref:F-box domain-containing protein n=1 Tax=Mycena citricolor TaxID=2018698 RepID=A0AAD2K977_9AGAR|nr:unnamed protein product [Mycena citricolor]
MCFNPTTLPQASMHPALRVAEIRHLICEAIGADELKGILAALAQTCQAFFQPAIKVLWAAVELGYWLRYTMPEDVWNGDWYFGTSRVLSLRRDIVVQDWTRSVIYSPFIRRLICPASGGTALDVAQSLGGILICPPPETCFVSLRYLTWHQNNLTAMRPFLGPNLTSLHIWTPCLVGTIDESMKFLLEVSRRFSRTMRDIGFHFDTSDNRGPADLISSLFAVYADLRCASAHVANQQALIFLGALPRLQSLSVTFVTDLEDFATLAADRSFFPSLQALELQAVTQLEANLLFSALTTSPLSTLHLGLRGLVLNSAFESLLASITRGSQSELRLLDISSLDHREDGDLWSLTLLTCSFFSSLTNISIESHVGFEITNESLGTLAQNLPHIAELRLWAANSGGKHVTLPCLASFAENCRSLRTLKIPLDACDVAWALSILASRAFPRQRALRELMVLNAGIERPSDVAAYLSILFGALKKITTMADEGDEGVYDGAYAESTSASYWEEVHRLL